MAENRVTKFLQDIPAPVWVGVFGLLAANSVWSDAKKAAKEFGEKTGEAMKEVERSKEFLLTLPEFKAGYFNNLKGQRYKLFTQASAEKLAKELSEVKGFFNDNEELLFTVLNKIPTHTQLAQVAQKFAAATGKNLGAYIVSFTNTNERHRVEKIINAMATGLL